VALKCAPSVNNTDKFNPWPWLASFSYKLYQID
jgi:hypothetical protein